LASSVCRVFIHIALPNTHFNRVGLSPLAS
jgi:hypothetical protein